MFTFIKQLFGFDKPTMKDAGVQLEQAPYKVPEPAPVTPIPLVPEAVNPQCSDSVTQPDGAECKELPKVVDSQITDSVTQAPAKKPRKPRAPKVVAEKPAAKKAAPSKKAAAMKATAKKPKSKKA
jgi:hypothetical protein